MNDAQVDFTISIVADSTHFMFFFSIAVHEYTLPRLLQTCLTRNTHLLCCVSSHSFSGMFVGLNCYIWRNIWHVTQMQLYTSSLCQMNEKCDFQKFLTYIWATLCETRELCPFRTTSSASQIRLAYLVMRFTGYVVSQLCSWLFLLSSH